MKMMDGAYSLVRQKHPGPTWHISAEYLHQLGTNQLQEGGLGLCSTGWASKVFPVPRGPYISTPFGGWIPRFSKFSLWFIGRTMASTSPESACAGLRCHCIVPWASRPPPQPSPTNHTLWAGLRVRQESLLHLSSLLASVFSASTTPVTGSMSVMLRFGSLHSRPSSGSPGQYWHHPALGH